MGLKTDLIKAKQKAAIDTGMPPIDGRPGTFVEREAEYVKEAIVDFLTKAEFRITQLNAPVVLEDLKTPPQLVNIELETLLGEYGPLLKTLKQIGNPLGLGPAIDALEGEIEQAVTPLLEGGATTQAIDIKKDDGGLESTGYVYIGKDPDLQEAFDVSSEYGLREFTTVKLFRKDIEKLLT